MFLLNAQINYGAAFAWSHLRRLYQGNVEVVDNKKWDEFKGIHGFFTVAGALGGFLFGGQIFVGTPFTKGDELFKSHYYGGAKAIVGYSIADIVHLYGGVGFEAESITDLKKQAHDAVVDAKHHKSDWFKNIVLSADADIYVSSGIGFGISASGRLPWMQESDGHLSGEKSFSAIRIMAKVILRHL